MNPIFPVLVIIGALILWICINSLFPIIGKCVCELFDETKNNIFDERENEE